MNVELVPEREDNRSDGPMTGSPDEVLRHWLDLYRESVLIKIGGLDAEQLARREIPPSTLSLIGVVRHLTEVEAYWVREVLAGEQVTDGYYSSPQDPEAEFDGASPATALADVAAYERQVGRCRAVLAQWPDLTAASVGRRRGEPVNVAWILTHLIEEYARHLGHMDLLREVVDGRTGY